MYMKIIRKTTAFDGTILIMYADATGYVNTVPLYVFKKLTKTLKNGRNNANGYNGFFK